MSTKVYLKCVKIYGKLRVRIISDGYNKNSNCQFPKKLRIEDRVYSVNPSSITLSSSRGTHFYRISASSITIENEEIILPEHIYTDDDPDCIICLSNVKEIIFVPCGHFNMCNDCNSKLVKRNCPICRQIIVNTITPDMMI